MMAQAPEIDKSVELGRLRLPMDLADKLTGLIVEKSLEHCRIFRNAVAKCPANFGPTKNSVGEELNHWEHLPFLLRHA